MDSYSTREPDPRAAGHAAGELKAEEGVQQGSTSRTSQASVSAALAAVRAGARDASSPNHRFPGEDGGRSLAAMAQRDLDVALQLLADRAQYITGASGAAIALRRDGRNDMLCRASTGSNAPEVGALLSTEFGLSGESVRTRRALRCDDTERDARVNHEVCRQLGIASVVVMPVVNDDEVLGVFELFSGKAHAFGERDLSALQRLSEMVETAVRMARAAEIPPERLELELIRAAKGGSTVAHAPAPTAAADIESVIETEVDTEVETEVEGEIFETSAHEVAAPVSTAAAPATEMQPVLARSAAASEKKPLLWSAAASGAGKVQNSAQSDQMPVPAGLSHLRKCEVCGFPVSPGRSLCVECEEKRWRGQLRRQPLATPRPTAAAPPTTNPARTVAAASSVSAAAAAPAPARETPSAPAAAARNDVKASQSKDLAAPQAVADVAKASPIVAPSATSSSEDLPKDAPQAAQSASPELVLSAGLQPSQSWFAANKYILGALLVVAGVVAAILLLR